jgi:Protein of unknown function (DUF3800)
MSPDLPARFRLFYVDDSGSPLSGIVLYAWLETDAAGWAAGNQSWFTLRQLLYERYAIPASYVLHAATFAGGHGNPSTNPGWNRIRHLRGEVLQLVLAHLAATPGVRIGAAYRRTTARRHAYARHRRDVYQLLAAHLDVRLAAHDEHGLVFNDGDGTDPSYAAAHRNLTLGPRRLIEDPQYPGSASNWWLQLADLVAWTTFQHLHRAPNRRFAWPWYDTYLASVDVNDAPVQL